MLFDRNQRGGLTVVSGSAYRVFHFVASVCDISILLVGAMNEKRFAFGCADEIKTTNAHLGECAYGVHRRMRSVNRTSHTVPGIFSG
jgi:hypothetical protein